MARSRINNLRLQAEAEVLPADIGIFDSGVGGLSVVRELQHRQFRHGFTYIADQAHAPYGERALDEILQLSLSIADFLVRHGANIIVLACNTASAAALYELRNIYPEIHFVGMEPAVKPAAERTACGKVGVLATSATLAGEPYAGVLRRFAGDVAVFTQVCPDFVRLVGTGDVSSAHARRAVAKNIRPLLNKGVDKLALACTHYSFLAPLIRQVAGDSIEVIDPAAAVATQVERITGHLGKSTPVESGQPEPRRQYFTTGRTADFEITAARLLNSNLHALQLSWKS